MYFVEVFPILKSFVNCRVVKDVSDNNKGWFGQFLDSCLSDSPKNICDKDGHDFELKCVQAKVTASGHVKPSQTIAVTQFNPRKILSQSYNESPVYCKLEKVIIVFVDYSDDRSEATILKVASFKAEDYPDIENDFRSIKSVLEKGEISNYSSRGTSKNSLQLRTKGRGKDDCTICPVTGSKFSRRAFYLTKEFLKRI